MLSILIVVSAIASASSPSKRQAVPSTFSGLQVYDVMNPGPFNLLHEWLSDSDLFMHTLRRLKGSEDAYKLVLSIKALQNLATVSDLVETVLAVRQGPVQEFLSKRYRRARLTKSFFIDANVQSPVFRHSELAEGLQVLRDYIGLVNNPAMPLAECLPPMFREPLAYSQIAAPDDSVPKWRKLSLLEAGSKIAQARKQIADPLKRIKCVLLAPKLFEGENRRQDLEGRFICARPGIADVVTGRVVRVKDTVTLLPEVGAVLVVDTKPDGSKTCTIHWHTRTVVIDIAEGVTLGGVVVKKQTGHIMLVSERADHSYSHQQFHEDPLAGDVEVEEMILRYVESACSQHLETHGLGLHITRIGLRSEVIDLVRVKGTDIYFVVDNVTSTIFHAFKAQMKDFQPQSLLDAYQKAPGTSEMQQALATAFFTTDSSLALAIIETHNSRPILSSAIISQMYRDAFP